MVKVKKENVQQGAKFVSTKIYKGPVATAQKKDDVKNGINKKGPKKHSMKLPGKIQEQVKNQKNKKSLMSDGNLNKIATVKAPINKNQKIKSPSVGLQNKKGKVDNKELKNGNPQIKAANNIPASKPLNKNKRKASPENNLKQQLGPVPKLPVSPGPKNKGKKQIPSKIQKKIEKKKQDLEQSFDEAKFNEIVKEETVTKVVEAVKKIAADEVGQKKNRIFSDYRYILDVVCFKIPSCPKRMVKLKLKHSVVTEEDEVCLFVKDLNRGMRVDYEPTIHHYEDLLREKGVKGIKTIMPFNQLRKEYGSFEMKKKLANTYDYFMCDGSIIGHVAGFLGTKFQNSRCTPHAVRFEAKNLAREIEKSLHKTSYKQGAKGTIISIPVAHYKMSSKSVVENILDVISQLKKVYPGGLANIRSMNLRVNMKATSSLPLYVSLAPPLKSSQKTPFVIGQREEKLKKLKEKANKILEQFDLTPAGDISKKRQIENTNENTKEPPLKKKKKDKASKLTPNVEKKRVQTVQPEEAAKEKSLKGSKISAQNLKQKLTEIAASFELLRDAHGSVEEDEEDSGKDENAEEGSTEDGSDEEGSDEEGSFEKGSDEEGSDEEGSDEEGIYEEGSDEEGSDEEGIFEEGSDEEGSDEEGSDDAGSDDAGSDDAGSDDAGSDEEGSDEEGSDEEDSDEE